MSIFELLFTYLIFQTLKSNLLFFSVLTVAVEEEPLLTVCDQHQLLIWLPLFIIVILNVFS